MSKLRILSIGTDVTAVNPNSAFHQRLQTYCQYHDFFVIILAVGKPTTIQIGDSKVIFAGGSNKITAFWHALRVSYQVAKKKPPDKITTQDVLYSGLIGYGLARWFNKPLYVQLHGDYLDNPRWISSGIGTGNRVMNLVGKYILQRADKIRTVSKRIKTQIEKSYGIASERVTSIPIGTNLSVFQPTTTVNREACIIFAQRLIPEKCPLLFTRVATSIMQKYPNVTVAIAGEGELRQEMEYYFKVAGVSDRVRFYGFVTHDKLVQLYQTAICYLHTADWEGWGLPMIEAMAAGCPVVTTDTGCAGEAVRHEETGLVTPINDEAALQVAVERLLTDTELWQRLSAAATQEAQAWSFVSLTHKFMKWYEE